MSATMKHDYEETAPKMNKKHKPIGKRLMAEDKLQEKRLKERARRNGMASSIDEMRLVVPQLKDSKKAYSQAKVVAIALDHIYELQEENNELRKLLAAPGTLPAHLTLEKFNVNNKRLANRAGRGGSAKRRRVELSSEDEESSDSEQEEALNSIEAQLMEEAPSASTESTSSSTNLSATNNSKQSNPLLSTSNTTRSTTNAIHNKNKTSNPSSKAASIIDGVVVSDKLEHDLGVTASNDESSFLRSHSIRKSHHSLHDDREFVEESPSVSEVDYDEYSHHFDVFRTQNGYMEWPQATAFGEDTSFDLFGHHRE